MAMASRTRPIRLLGMHRKPKLEPRVAGAPTSRHRLGWTGGGLGGSARSIDQRRLSPSWRKPPKLVHVLRKSTWLTATLFICLVKI
jgi:hypothetical protein